MRHERLLASMISLSLGVLMAASCSSSTGGNGGGGSNPGGNNPGGNNPGGNNPGGGGAGTGSLHWFTTCGDPVCGTGGAGTGGSTVAACTTEKEGDACTQDGAQCDAGAGCHVALICAKADPKTQPGGCPISRARYKTDVDYVADGQLQSLHDELMTMRLATWRYKTEPPTARPHLGFIIDDNPSSVSVDGTGDKVDLYGYTSMAVAAAQVQDRRIEALDKELRALREEIAALKKQAAR